PAYRRFVRRINFREALDMYNGNTWLHDRRAYVEWLVATLNFGEPHSTRQIEDGIAWAMDADSRTLVDWWTATDIDDRAILNRRDEVLEYCSRVRCPVLLIQGELDVAVPPDWGPALADATGRGFLPAAERGRPP